jgi:hypothetical protein
MTLAITKLTCSCGATIESAFTAELNGWLGHHQKCIKSATPMSSSYGAHWSVFNTGACVADGLTMEEAKEYMTPERIARGWTAVHCVVVKSDDEWPVTKQEQCLPVHQVYDDDGDFWEDVGNASIRQGLEELGAKTRTLYTTPQRLKPLTDEQIANIVIEMNGNEPPALFWKDLTRAIEAAHGIKE